MAFANEVIISYLRKVKPPYNISTLNQQEAIKAIGHVKEYEHNKRKIINEKAALVGELEQLECVQMIYPSDTNFLLVKFRNAESIYHLLRDCGVIVRNRVREVADCLRITVGTKSENKRLVRNTK